jgi:hypothetical protein
MARFEKGKRRKRRTKMVVPVRVRFAGGAARDLRVAHTLDATESGVRLGGLVGEVKVDDLLEIHHRHKRAWFRVVWIKNSENPSERLLGAVCVEQDKNIWEMSFPPDLDEYETKDS